MVTGPVMRPIIQDIQIDPIFVNAMFVLDQGSDLMKTWSELAYREPPSDLLGKLFWFAGVLGQLIISVFTLPAGIGCFLMEESVQTAGMGAYMLATTRNYDLLSDYLPNYRDIINSCYIATKDLTIFSPVAGSATLIYLGCASMSCTAFEAIAERELIKQAEYDEAARKKLLDDQKLGDLYITSSPSQANIILDGRNLDKLTPETIKGIEIGDHTISLWKYSASREVYDTFQFTITIVAGKKLEVRVHIPEAQTNDIENPEGKEEETKPKLPDFIKAEITCERCIDGDTIQSTTGERIRFLGIDAPELGTEYGEISKEYMKKKTEDKKLEISIQTNVPFDAYGRTLAFVRYYGENLSVSSVADGMSRVFIADDATYDPVKLQEAEKLAQERKVGIWSALP